VWHSELKNWLQFLFLCRPTVHERMTAFDQQPRSLPHIRPASKCQNLIRIFWIHLWLQAADWCVCDIYSFCTFKLQIKNDTCCFKAAVIATKRNRRQFCFYNLFESCPEDVYYYCVVINQGARLKQESQYTVFRRLLSQYTFVASLYTTSWTSSYLVAFSRSSLSLHFYYHQPLPNALQSVRMYFMLLT